MRELCRYILSEQLAGLGVHEEGDHEVFVLPKVYQILVIVVGDGVECFGTAYFVEIALALADGAYDHGGGLYDFFQLILHRLFGRAVDVHALII